MLRSRIVSFVTALLLALTLAPFPAPVAVQAQDATPVASAATRPVILVNAPGMRPELMEAFAAEGALPALAGMLEQGAMADGGLLAPFPATAGTSAATLLTGTWPAEHGIVGDRFYRTGSPDFADWAAWDDPELIQADSLPQAAERAGKQVVSIGWAGIAGLDPSLNGPVVGEMIPFSRAGVLTNIDLPEQPALAESLGVAYERVELRPAEGWTGAPESFSPARETDLSIPSLDAAGPNPDRTFAVYVYDSTDDTNENYDRMLVSSEKDASTPVAELDAGAWASATVALSGERDGQAAGFWLKALEIAPDLSTFRLYHTPIGRLSASWADCADLPECDEPGGFEEALNDAIGAPVTADAAPLEAGLIDAATFVAQGTTGAWQTVDAARFVVDDLGVQPDLLLLGSSFPAAVSRQFLGVQASMAGSAATPTSDIGSVDSDAFLRDSYAMADQLLAVGQELLGPEATTLFTSPGGLAPSTFGVNAGQVLAEAGLAEVGQPENCVPGPVSEPPGTPDPEALPVGPAVKACWSGGTAHIYINLDGREAAGSVAEDALRATQDAVVEAFTALRDPERPDDPVVAGFLLKEDLRDVAGTDALHPSRSGDVVIVLLPPYRFADDTAGAAIAPVAPAAVGGYLIQAEPEADQAATGLFLAAGPEIAAGAQVAARSIDVAPTAAFLLDVPGPYNASGSILYDLLANGSTLREVTLLDISDFHGQLPPLSAAADDIEADGAVNATYEVGGVATLAVWFDHFRAEANGETLVVTAGDAVGATPPISQVFGDLPTIEAMNALGFTADSLGNHNFDAGYEYMFETLAPAADFPYLSVNLVPAEGGGDASEAGEASFQPSLVLDVDGVSVGLIGFSNPDIPLLTRPGALGPYQVADPAPAINAEAARLRDEGVEAIVAIGHMGALGGTLTDPTGPVVDVTDQLQGVNVVVGDHTDVQVSALRPNGTLLVENRSKGVMFTRVRIVVDSESGEVVYLTADHHRPWVIGVTPDAELVAEIERLETELAPILGQAIGSAVQPILRADICGMETGRTCESLIGNIVADAMRFAYGTDFAITNSGGIRADLTCPPEGAEFCPTDAGANAISEGRVLTVLPFGNIAVTLEVSGAEIKTMLETGVSHMPEASGAFPQVSGLCFTYDIEAEPGNRVTGAVRQAEDGSCTGEAIDLTEAATYTLATNDFTASGGDGYPDVLARTDSRDILASVVAAYIAGESPLQLPGEPLDPQVEGRIDCEGEGCPVPVGG
jgi:2',3'-cyclic-nucleotide 2'-phosphodiesterase (5'-nucleotidase family)